ncbi:MAG: hypothetical protein KAX49_20755, partial [Halanaerobiales bacterium]|nr:hypothetical protein [Halanaerobiales bacterium]
MLNKSVPKGLSSQSKSFPSEDVPVIIPDDEGNEMLVIAEKTTEVTIKNRDETRVMVTGQYKYLDKDSSTAYSSRKYSYDFKDNDPANNVEWATVLGSNGQK